jgi:hypothetical protein
MTERDEWLEVAGSLEEIEARYRKERLRIGPAAQPSGQAKETLVDLLERAVDCYLHGDEARRAEMRGFFAKADCVPRALLAVAGRSQRRILEGGDLEEHLRRALGAISLEDFHVDYRDSFQCLEALYLLVHRRGENPQPEFDAVARLSSTERARTYKRGSMRDVLAGFEKTDYFRADVQRKLDPGVAR